MKNNTYQPGDVIRPRHQNGWVRDATASGMLYGAPGKLYKKIYFKFAIVISASKILEYKNWDPFQELVILFHETKPMTVTTLSYWIHHV